MANPQHKMILPCNRHRQAAFPFKYPTRTSIRAIKLSFPWLKRREDRKLTCIKGRVSSKNDGYMVSELERENEKEDNEEIITGKEGKSKLADTWLEIPGADNWEGMLDPLDPLLRSELIRYGEMAQACYNAFDSETFSKYCGSCKYTPTKFFECLGLMQHGNMMGQHEYVVPVDREAAVPAKKKTQSSRIWILLDCTGQSTVLDVDKYDIMRRCQIHSRDLRILDPLLSYPSTIIGREKAIVLNLEHIKAIITSREVLLRDPVDEKVIPVVAELQRRLPPVNAVREACWRA
ncbi:hypothetical protein Pint_24683 [Pistacia integerrima]|uniref:Uncharacterized protein n=1 Tax=Pistacia integerrima TaxID=434235 RepID=A0ACC0YI69_9ROSI|nr:hypothetical protein Pint_24683 [Pistacia integerrima]